MRQRECRERERDEELGIKRLRELEGERLREQETERILLGF